MVDSWIYCCRYWLWVGLYTIYNGCWTAFLQTTYTGPECSAERSGSWNSCFSCPHPDPPGSPCLEGHLVDPLRNSPQPLCLWSIDVPCWPGQTSPSNASSLLCSSPKHYFPWNVYSKPLLEFRLHCDIHVLACLRNGPGLYIWYFSIFGVLCWYGKFYL